MIRPAAAAVVACRFWQASYSGGVQEPYGYYHSHKGFTKEAALTTALQVYGRNSFDMPLPQFLELLKEQMLAPFFVFQVFCVGLWCLDEYWYYSLFTLGMLVMFESTVVGQRLRNLKELRSLQTPKQGVQVYRCVHAPLGQRCIRVGIVDL